MAVLAALTLIIGVLPDIFLNPITTYINGMFAGNENVQHLPHAGATSGSPGVGPVPKQTTVSSGSNTQSHATTTSTILTSSNLLPPRATISAGGFG
jgi:hypothetical protein